MPLRMPALFFWTREPDERAAREPVHRAVGNTRSKLPKTESRSFSVGALVHSRCGDNSKQRSKDNPRLRRASARPVSSAVSRARDPDLAARVQKLLAPLPVRRDERWGLDHGTWSVLCHVYARADIPVVQLSIDETQPPPFHHEIGKRLATLREEGILILGSGNVVHNLHAYAWGATRTIPEPYDRAIAFEKTVRELLLAEEYDPLINYENQLGSEADLALPTPDHYLPLLYVVGARMQSEPLTFPVEGVDGGSVSMLAVRVG
jgi:hypothetical protein